jgi:hypothetical protein
VVPKDLLGSKAKLVPKGPLALPDKEPLASKVTLVLVPRAQQVPKDKQVLRATLVSRATPASKVTLVSKVTPVPVSRAKLALLARLAHQVDQLALLVSKA